MNTVLAFVAGCIFTLLCRLIPYEKGYEKDDD
jgi:hypothetical protein